MKINYFLIDLRVFHKGFLNNFFDRVVIEGIYIIFWDNKKTAQVWKSTRARNRWVMFLYDSEKNQTQVDRCALIETLILADTDTYFTSYFTQFFPAARMLGPECDFTINALFLLNFDFSMF